ncbi:hypothetical protein [Pseudomonas protegens]|uniref:hypothetical protein n=1 Tax=Pseudomonas protegens TaxID=380021 RepID=UPI000FF0847F|nr:hypothetical protein [Pseudomonas protegens]ROL86518.1 hypothetical protein BK639_28360 [Pseudomonas protegens]ROL95144.1 hypothetical protein BK640_29080 [Pseudomonas protegens]ROL97867.1 hypothetical protein BK641_27025 [Pseudomonas protegens]ROM07653.1 hypothetical protein BK642_13925 [Pseudomonas protegens]
MLDQIDKLIDGLGKVSHLAYLKRERARIQAAARPKCGNCHFWMKTRECPAEKNVNGMSRGPSCEGIACQKFQACPRMQETFAKLLSDNEAEITAITA